MAYKWDSSFEIGDKTVDAQHKEFIEKFDSLLTDLALERPTNELENALDFLCHYTEEHFAAEEALMRQVNLPDYENHKIHHEFFKATAAKLTEQFKRDGLSEELSIQLRLQIGDWLITHIKGEDSKIKDYLK